MKIAAFRFEQKLDPDTVLTEPCIRYHLWELFDGIDLSIATMCPYFMPSFLANKKTIEKFATDYVNREPKFITNWQLFENGFEKFCGGIRVEIQQRGIQFSDDEKNGLCNYIVILMNKKEKIYFGEGKMLRGAKHGISTETFEDGTKHRVFHDKGRFIKNL